MLTKTATALTLASGLFQQTNANLLQIQNMALDLSKQVQEVAVVTTPPIFTTDPEGRDLSRNPAESYPEASSSSHLDLASTVSTNLNAINGYGCWCYLGVNRIVRNRGPALNKIDGYCRTLHQGYECAVRDGASSDRGLDQITDVMDIIIPEQTNFNEPNDGRCAPWSVDYTAGVTLQQFFMENEEQKCLSLKIECAEKNQHNACAQKACLIEGHFVLNLLKAFFDEETFDTSKKHQPAGLFDPKSSCRRQFSNKDHGHSGTECCGTYPIRAPFKLGSAYGQRSCCGNATYNPMVETCCDAPGVIGGKKIASIGSC